MNFWKFFRTAFDRTHVNGALVQYSCFFYRRVILSLARRFFSYFYKGESHSSSKNPATRCYSINLKRTWRVFKSPPDVGIKKKSVEKITHYFSFLFSIFLDPVLQGGKGPLKLCQYVGRYVSISVCH